MYNISVHGQQALSFTLLSVSVTETDDMGTTQVLFTVQDAAGDRSPDYEPGSLEEFLEQVVVCLSRALSTPHPGSSAPNK